MANEKDTSTRTRHTAEDAARTASSAAGEAAGVARGEVQSGEDMVRRFGQFFGTQARVTEDMANRTTQNFDVIMSCGSVLTDGWQSILKEWLSYGQGAFQRNVDGVNEMMRARTIEDFVSTQNDRLREEVELLLNSSVRVSEITARVASDARERLHERAKRGRGRA